MSAELTIEQLAAASGMSVRNIRAHQARGLLDPPTVRVRVGYYGADHVARLKLIAGLQADGFNLAGIKRLLEDESAPTQPLVRVREALAAAPGAETPEVLTLAELGRRFQVRPEQAPEVLRRAQELGILVADGPDRFLATSPALLEVAERVVGRGIALVDALDVFARIERHCDAVSESVVELFVEQVWRPYERAGLPERDWAEIDSAIAALRPLAGDALQAIFARRMSAQIDAAFGELTRRLDASGEPAAASAIARQ